MCVTSNMNEKLELARELMVKAHKGQTRWDGRPYFVHPAKVVALLQKFGIHDEDVLSAGYLHDVLEDTKLSEQVIEDQFGDRVLGLVKELTFQKGSDEQYLEQVKKLSYQAQQIKIADILANITDQGKKSQHYIDKRLKALAILLECQIPIDDFYLNESNWLGKEELLETMKDGWTLDIISKDFRIKKSELVKLKSGKVDKLKIGRGSPHFDSETILVSEAEIVNA